MRLPLPGPGDLLRVADRGYDAIERVIALVPRIGRLIDQIERIAERADAIVSDVDRTRRRADEVIDHTDELVARAGILLTAAEQLLSNADGLLGQADGPLEQAGQLLERFQPALTELAPMVDELARTTSPTEVAALVRLVDTLPELVERLETEILPILGTFGTVAPDIRDLLETTREFNEILGSVPGLGRIKKRVEERQEQQDSERA